jgi:CHAD domain-containing protein
MPTGHREVETKYDVDDATQLPDLADLPDVARVADPQTFRLEATYYDTTDLALGRRGITLRRRTGGEDEGWHLKVPLGDDRHEFGAALGRSTRMPPVGLRRIIKGIVRDDSLTPIATLVTDRTVVSLHDDEDSLLAELADDRVVATRSGNGDQEHSWREWELEEHGARRKLAKAAASRLREAGARRATHHSKFGRVMELDSSDPTARARRPGKRASEQELIGHHLVALRADLHRLDPLARADLPDAVHQLRVAIRRLRAALTTFDKSFDSSATEPIVDDLNWIGDMLGRPRDLEVLHTRLGRLLEAQPAHLVRGRPGQWIDSQHRAARRAAHRDALEAMASDRYFGLIDALATWDDTPPWKDNRDRPATGRLARALDREWTRMEKAAASAEAGDAGERPVLLHKVRKAAKRTRYAAEALEPVLGSDARTMAKAAHRIQRVLGGHHDTVIAGERLLELSDAARAAGRDTFTFGALSTRLEAELSEIERDYERVWIKAHKGKPRRRKH